MQKSVSRKKTLENLMSKVLVLYKTPQFDHLGDCTFDEWHNEQRSRMWYTEPKSDGCRT